jgi:hypothetical protein
MAGDHDDGGAGELILAHADEIEAVHIADAKVHNDEVGLVGTDGRNAVDAGGTAKNLMTRSFAKLGHEFQDGGFVVYDY